MIKKKAVKKKAKEKRNTQQEKNHEVENVMFFPCLYCSTEHLPIKSIA
jgi:hypothetical protein